MLAWCITAYGLTNILSISKIFGPVRRWLLKKVKTPLRFIGELLSCVMCTGFWVGLLLYLCGYSLTGYILFDGFAASGASWLLHGVAYKLLSYEYSAPRQHPPAQ